MTTEEFTRRMLEIKSSSGGDVEAAHGQMDDLLVEALVSLGYQEGITIYRSQRKWYA